MRDEAQFGICRLPGSVNVPWSVLQSLRLPVRSRIGKNSPNEGSGTNNGAASTIDGSPAGQASSESTKSATPNGSNHETNNEISNLSTDVLGPLSSLNRLLVGKKEVYTICRFGNDSQLAVRKLEELGFGKPVDEERDGNEGGDQGNGGGEDGGDVGRVGSSGKGIRIRDVKGGFRAWREEVDGGWPDY